MGLVCGHDDVLTGLVSNSRPEEADGERVLGLFLNTLPLRLALRAESWRSLLRRVFQAEREGLPHRRYPAGRLQRQQPGEPLYETAFNYNHFHVYSQLQNRPGLDVSRPQVFEYTNFALMTNFDLDPQAGGLLLRLNYNTAVFAAAQAEALAGYYLECLRAMAAEPGGDALAADLLGEERQQVLREFNRTAAVNPHSGTLQAAFEEEAQRRPQATALLADGGSLSYGELDGRANQLAHWLRGAGVGADRVVGVLMQRSLRLPLALYWPY